MRLTRADLDVQGCLLTLATRITRAEWVHSEGPPRPIADQQLWMQWERTTMEQDDESDHQESDTAEHAPVTPSERESGFHKISLQIDPLMCSDSELPRNRTDVLPKTYVLFIVLTVFLGPRVRFHWVNT